MSGTNNYPQGFPRYTAQLVDPETGIIKDPWLRLIIKLWERTGGPQGSNTNGTVDLTARNSANMSTLLTVDDPTPPPDINNLIFSGDSDEVATPDINNLIFSGDSDEVATPDINNLIFSGDSDALVRDLPPSLGKVSGRSYPAWDGNVAATGVVNAADTLYLYPYYLDDDIYLNAFFLRVVTAGTATQAAAKAGIWSSVAGRPSGLPFVVDNTGVDCSVTGIRTFSVTPTFLPKGWYWLGSKFQTATLQPVCTNIVGTSILMASRIGASSTANAILNGATNQMPGLSVAATYASSLPDLTGTGLTDVAIASSGIPVLGYTVG